MVISFTNKKSVLNHDYTIDGSLLTRSAIVKDLGVILTHNLNFKPHVSNAVNKAFRMMGFIKRTCQSFKDIKPIVALYNCYVKTNLEYCSVIWSPWQKSHIDQIERVQRKFVKFLCFKSALPYDRERYSELCMHFNLPQLHQRRSFLDSVFIYKCVNSFYDCPDILSHIHFYAPQRTLRGTHIFRLERSRTNCFKFSPLLRCMSTFNMLTSLDSTIDLFSPISIFKNCSRRILFKPS